MQPSGSRKPSKVVAGTRAGSGGECFFTFLPVAFAFVEREYDSYSPVLWDYFSLYHPSEPLEPTLPTLFVHFWHDLADDGALPFFTAWTTSSATSDSEGIPRLIFES